MNKIIKFLITLSFCFVFLVFGFYLGNNTKDIKYHGTGELKRVEYINGVEYEIDEERISFNLCFDTSIDFAPFKSEQTFLYLNFEGETDFYLPNDENVIVVQLIEGNLPERFSYSIDLSKYDSDEIDKLLNGENEYVLATLALYDPSGIIVSVSNSIIK